MAVGAALDIDELVGKLPTRSSESITRLRTTHHELARLLAMGYKNVEVSRMTGYSQSRISILLHDPMFAELVNDYAAQRDVSAVDISGRLTALAVDAVEVMAERLQDSPDGLSVKELHSIATLGLDRTGFGPTAKSVNVNISSKQSLEEIKAAVLAEVKGRVVSRDQEPEVGGIALESTAEDTGAEAPEGSESEGPAL